MHVRGYIEEGSITTPFDMRVQNKMDRYHLILLALKHIEGFDTEELENYCQGALIRHKEYIKENGIDMKEITEWKWNL